MKSSVDQRRPTDVLVPEVLREMKPRATAIPRRFEVEVPGDLLRPADESALGG